VVGGIQIKMKLHYHLIYILFLLAGCQNLPTKNSSTFSYCTSELHSGDIILRRSYGFISDVVVMQLKDTLDISHCGILVKDSTDNFDVIHCLSDKVSDTDGVQSCSLDYFMNDSKIETVRVVRFRNDTTGYIAKMALFYLKQRTGFDDEFNISDSTLLFCSEFPIHIIKNGFNIDISSKATKPKFSIFLNPKYFDEIEFVRN
jgi:hypothetical protein